MGAAASSTRKLVDKMIKPCQAETKVIESIEKMNETVEMLEKKEKMLEKKASAELERAKEFTKLKNKKAAVQCLKKKKMYEAQFQNIENYKMRIQDQMLMVDNTKATTETLSALKAGAQTMKAMQKETNIEDIDDTLQEIAEQSEVMKELQEALSAAPAGIGDLDDDELEAELSDLVEEDNLEEEAQVYPSASSKPITGGRVAARRQSNLQYQDRDTLKQPVAVMIDELSYSPATAVPIDQPTLRRRPQSSAARKPLSGEEEMIENKKKDMQLAAA